MERLDRALEYAGAIAVGAFLARALTQKGPEVTKSWIERILGVGEPPEGDYVRAVISIPLPEMPQDVAEKARKTVEVDHAEPILNPPGIKVYFKPVVYESKYATLKYTPQPVIIPLKSATGKEPSISDIRKIARNAGKYLYGTTLTKTRAGWQITVVFTIPV